MNKIIKPWYEYSGGLLSRDFTFQLGICLSNFKGLFIAQAIDEGLQISTNFDYKEVNVDFSVIKSQVDALGGKPSSYLVDVPKDFNRPQIPCYYSKIWDDAALEVIFEYLEDGSQGPVSMTWFSNNNELSDKFFQLRQFFKKEEKKGAVNVLVSGVNGFELHNIGIGKSPLIEDNYNSSVIDSFNKVIEDIKSNRPSGKLSIFDGPPGTGKTFLIRALLDKIPDVSFLILPSNMAESLSGPELTKTLINCNSKKQTTVLIIEDADRCLSRRAADNISAISNILNLSDGIVGNLLNLRIVCTTNAEVEDIDAALLRSGRLSARVEVGLLDNEKAKQVYSRIKGCSDVELTDKYYSLSDIYCLASGNVPETKKAAKPKIGFGA